MMALAVFSPSSPHNDSGTIHFSVLQLSVAAPLGTYAQLCPRKCLCSFVHPRQSSSQTDAQSFLPVSIGGTMNGRHWPAPLMPRLPTG